MSGFRRNVTLLVDGSVLKKHMYQLGQTQTPQLVVQYLSHMVRTVREQEPDAKITVQYYGSRLTETVALPVSRKPYKEIDLKAFLNHHSIPDAVLNNSWGRVSYPFDQAWILKAENLNKTHLLDADFVLNEKPKGVLAQLVCKMAEHAVRSPETPLYVYGDMDDMAYALHTSQWLGAKVRQINLSQKTPIINEIPMGKEPRSCDKIKMKNIGEFVSMQPDTFEAFKNLRAQCPEQDKKSLLLLDVGIIRKFLDKSGCRMSVQNVQTILKQIEDSLPEKPSQTVLYCTFSSPSKLVSPFPGEVRTMIDSSEDKQILAIPNVKCSAGKTIQDKWHPFILKKESWQVPPTSRVYKDFEYNFHQCDVDDRIAYDIALYGMDPAVSQLYLLATDGDFAYPVEQAAQMGLPTTLIHLDLGARDISYRLQSRVNTTIYVSSDELKLTTRVQEEDNKWKAKREKSAAKRKQLQKMKRSCARAEGNDYVEVLTRADRWGELCSAHKREKRERLQHRR